MNKTQVARRAAATMHTAEDAVAAALKASREALSAMRSTTLALEMTSPEADAAISGWQDSIKLLETVEQGLIQAHKDGYQALQEANLRGVAVFLPGTFFSATEAEAA